MKIIVPMSGMGKRFVGASYKRPKPLIEVEGKPIIEHVVNMFPGETDFLFVCNRKHLQETNIAEILQRIMPTSTIVAIDYDPKGPVSVILQIQEHIKDDDEVIISYCDFFMNWNYAHFKKTIAQKNSQGAIICYTGFHPHLLRRQLYGGVKVTDSNAVTEVREKYRFTESPMETWHAVGAYYFKKGEYIKKYFKKLSKRKDLAISNEHYILTAYEFMLQDNLPCVAYETPHFFQWGTPEDLEIYLSWSQMLHDIAKKRMSETDAKYLDIVEQKVFKYWKECLSKMDFHPYQ